ncbi:hypothetical protein OQJ19_15840 [Fluoribacter gormanii]|uniref:hypothetical protein n=1 Tax=Fluoribacter gormanii TaxID=464 RepID=UPI0022432535|nr:hypothetical protein [Fluoribacter gormanii]MCW8472104.1 hypothetical protein [Fluoribacter gormanii]
MPVFESYLSYQPEKYLNLSQDQITQAALEEKKDQRFIRNLLRLRLHLFSCDQTKDCEILWQHVDKAVERFKNGEGLESVSAELRTIPTSLSKLDFEPLKSFINEVKQDNLDPFNLPLSETKQSLMSAMEDDFKQQMQMLESQFRLKGSMNDSLARLFYELHRDQTILDDDKDIILDPLGQCNKKLELLEQFKKDNPTLTNHNYLDPVQKMLEAHKNNLQAVFAIGFFSTGAYKDTNRIQKSPADLTKEVDKRISSAALQGILNNYLTSRSQEHEEKHQAGSCVTKQYRHKLSTLMQHSYDDKKKAVIALIDALSGKGTGNLSEHLSTLRNGDLGKELRSFIKAGHADVLFEHGQKPRTVSDFVKALDSQALEKSLDYAMGRHSIN